MNEVRNVKAVANSGRRPMQWGAASLLLAGLAACTMGDNLSLPAANWPVYGGSNAGQRYSQLNQITPANVRRLTVAWRVETGAGGLQTSPIMIGGVLYVCAPDQSVMALDAATGKQIWKFSSGVAGFQPARGLTYWQEKGERRLFASSSNYLYALDPATGKPVESFGTNGRIDLREGLGRDPKSLAVFMTSPGIVYREDDPTPLRFPNQRLGLVEFERERLFHQDGPNRRRVEHSVEDGRMGRIGCADAHDLGGGGVE